MNKLLKYKDPILFKILQQEFNRQRRSLELIASENFTSKSVLSVLVQFSQINIQKVNLVQDIMGVANILMKLKFYVKIEHYPLTG